MKRNARILMAALATTLLGMSSGAMAAFFTVTSTADMPDLIPGDGVCNAGAPFGCTLRAGVQEANALPGRDTILLDSFTYNLTRVGAGEDFADRGDLDVRDHLGIIGTGPFTVIDGQLADRIFDVHAVLPVPVTFTVGDMSIGRGYSGPNDGGAIRNAGHLNTVQLVVSSSISELRGGGIAGVGAASFEIRTTGITGNRAGSTNCSVPGGGGGGLFIASSANPHVVVTESYITNNVSCTHGGGILADGAIRLNDVSVRTNLASTSSGRGGGIHANVIEMERVGMDSNRSWTGGGLWFRREARILNSTISSNGAVTGGGGIHSIGWLHLRHVTMANNTSGDPVNPSGGLVHIGGYNAHPMPIIVNSILSSNSLANCRILDAGGATISLSTSNSWRNVDTDNSCGFSTVGSLGSIVLVPALLAPLASNGGMGRSHLLLVGSPARDTAMLGSFGCPQREQRNVGRPIGAGCDIGSTEQ
jgi:predicted outer membrane repeat protein